MPSEQVRSQFQGRDGLLALYRREVIEKAVKAVTCSQVVEQVLHRYPAFLRTPACRLRRPGQRE
jgi:hypothetical protein